MTRTTIVKQVLYVSTTKVKMKADGSEGVNIYQTAQTSTMTVIKSEERSRYNVISLSMVSRPSGGVIYEGVAKTADDVSRSRPKEDIMDLGKPGDQYGNDCSLGYEMLMSSIGGSPLASIARTTRMLWVWWTMIMVKTCGEEKMHYDEYRMHHDYVP